MRILLSQTASLGDVLLSTPLIAGIKSKHPDSELWFLTTPAAADLLKKDPRLAGVITFNKKSGYLNLLIKAGEIRKLRFDAAYAIQRSARASILLALAGIKQRIGFTSSALPFLFHKLVVRPKEKHDVLRNLALIEMDQAEETDLKLFPVDPSEISEKIRSELQEPYIALVPGSLWKTKRWKEQNFAELGKSLKLKGYKVIFLGAPDERQMVEECAAFSSSVSLAGKTSMQDMIYIISKAKALVCNDSSALHIASAFKTATVAIFCATSPDFGFGPWNNPNAIVLENKTLWCRPCARHGGDFCPTGTDLCRSATGHKDCVSVELVENALTGLIKSCN